MGRDRTLIGQIDWVVLVIYLALVAIGWLNIFAVEYIEGQAKFFNINTNYSKQLIFIGFSLLLALAALIVDARFYATFAYFFYGGALLLLVLTLLIGKTIAASKSWIHLGPFSLQPSEFAKFATALAIARYLSQYEVSMDNIRDRLMCFVLLFVPIGLVLLQNDLGSALVFFSLFLVFYREGLPSFFIFFPLYAGALFVAVLLVDEWIVLAVLAVIGILVYLMFRSYKQIAWLLIAGYILSVGVALGVDYTFNNVLQPHQKQRINVLLGKEIDLRGAGYNVHQSLIAIGSGGLTGKGFLDGTQTKFQFVPEQSTDFIFCTIGEEHGFLGSMVTVLLFVFLIYRLITQSERSQSDIVRIYGYGAASVIFFHFTINIGMTLGLLPVVGIPLPFISYGGSSLMAFTLLIFIWLKMQAGIKY